MRTEADILERLASAQKRLDMAMARQRKAGHMVRGWAGSDATAAQLEGREVETLEWVLEASR